VVFYIWPANYVQGDQGKVSKSMHLIMNAYKINNISDSMYLRKCKGCENLFFCMHMYKHTTHMSNSIVSLLQNAKLFWKDGKLWYNTLSYKIPWTFPRVYICITLCGLWMLQWTISFNYKTYTSLLMPFISSLLSFIHVRIKFCLHNNNSWYSRHKKDVNIIISLLM